jgi:hypothetical protein
MTWEEKLQAIRSLDCEAHLRMRKPGDWYVSSRIEVGGDGILSGAYGDGTNPEEAVLETWNKFVTELKSGYFLVLHAYTPKRKEVRWSGFMWEDLPCSVSPVKKT